MAEYKLTISLDATLAVQNANGSFNYFKPSIGAEISIGEADDLTILNNKFEELYEQVIGPNFKAVVEEFLINSDEKKDEKKKDCNCAEEDCKCKDKSCGCDNESCDCKSSENGENTIVDELDLELSVDKVIENLPKEEWE